MVDAAHPSGIIVTGAMIRVSGDDCQGSIELLDDQGPHNLVRHGERPEGNHEIGPLADPRIETVRPADDASHSWAALVAPLPDPRRESLAGGALPPLVEHDQ